MKKKTRNIILTVAAGVLLTFLVCGGTAYYFFFYPQFYPQENVSIYIDSDDTVDSIFCKLERSAHPKCMIGFQWLITARKYADHLHTGKYTIQKKDNVYDVFNRLYRGHQTTAQLTISTVRTLSQLAYNVGQQLMIDSAEIATQMNDSLYIASLGYTKETLPSLFIANTYEVYWNISVEAFFQRMQKEHLQFWNSAREKKAKEAGLTPVQVSTLASIVAEETNNVAEKPVIAGLYINRLRKGIPLQADPTIKFALQNFKLRRITNALVQTPSPYNTYLNTGLPPGPIRIPSPTDIDAVLNYARHNYLYMCAKEDFSGTHNFASNYAAHLRNARKYWNALNKRKIYR